MCEFKLPHFTGFEGFASPPSLVAVLVVPIPIMLFLVLHRRASLLFPALLSTRRIVRCSVTLFGSHHVLCVELRLFGQLVLIYDATFILARALRVGPVLLLSRSEDSVEDNP